MAEPWVSELESAWNQVLQDGWKRRIVVDLSKMTFIDPTGEATLIEMITQGARLIARGIYSEYVVERRRHRSTRAAAIGPAGGVWARPSSRVNVHP